MVDCPQTQMIKYLSKYETVCGTGYTHSRYTYTCANYYIWCNFKTKHLYS